MGYQSQRFAERLQGMVQELNGLDDAQAPCLAIECDLLDELSTAAAFDQLSRASDGRLHALLHSVAYAPASALRGRVVDVSAPDFAQTQLASVHTLHTATRHALPLLQAAQGASVLTLTYIGASQV